MKALTNNEGQSRAPGSISKALPPQVAPRSRGQPHTQEIEMKRSMKSHRGSWGHSRACLPFTDPRDPCLVAFSSSVNKDQNPQKKSSSLLRGSSLLCPTQTLIRKALTAFSPVSHVFQGKDCGPSHNTNYFLECCITSRAF